MGYSEHVAKALAFAEHLERMDVCRAYHPRCADSNGTVLCDHGYWSAGGHGSFRCEKLKIFVPNPDTFWCSLHTLLSEGSDETDPHHR